MSDIITQLKKALTKAVSSGWSINRLAKEAGVSRASLQEWHTGAQDSISLETAAGLAKFLGMKLSNPEIPKPDK